MKFVVAFCLSICFLNSRAQEITHVFSINEPIGELSPKSIRHNGQGIFSAQNMMYNHMISFYDRSFNLLGTLSDSVNLAHYGFCEKDSWFRGAPVECDFSNDGRYAFISNYKMYGKGFQPDASDQCRIHSDNERSYVYKIDLQSLEIVQIFQVGSVPKYVKYIDSKNWLAVSNWCSGTVSIIDLNTENTIKEIYVGTYPRGLDYHQDQLYVAVMGSNFLSKINLNTWNKEKIIVGNGPRDLRIDQEGKYLYLSLNNENKIAQLELSSNQLINKVPVGSLPRSMCLSKEENQLFYTEYGQHQFGVIKIPEMKLSKQVKTCYKPIGIEYDKDRDQLWVACYGGQISIYDIAEEPTVSEVKSSESVLKPQIDKKIEPIGSRVISIENKIQLIAGSFSIKENAVKRQRLLTAIGIMSKVHSFSGNYRVLAYDGPSIVEAQNMQAKLKQELKISSWIKR